MKKPLLVLSLLSLLAASCSGEASSSSASSQESSSPESSQIDGSDINEGLSIEYAQSPSAKRGKMIEVEEVSSSSELFSASHLIDRSGMSGNSAFYHTHASANQRETMFASNRGDKTGSIVFKFADFVRLGHLGLWNYNQASKLDVGVKEFSISYSEDNLHYHSLGSHILGKGSGEESYASHIDGKEYFDFAGVAARYVKLEVISNYGGNQFGLSEARFFEYEGEEGYLSSYSFLDANSEKNSIPSIAPGLVGDKLTANPYYQRATAKGALTYSLRGQYPLSELAIWNYNDPEHLDYGVKELRISVSLDNESYEEVGEYRLEKGSGQEGMEASLKVDLNNVRAQYVRFSFLSNYGGERNGLGAFALKQGEGDFTSFDYENTGLVSSYSSLWSGADGIFSTRLNGDQSIGGEGEVIFNFSDTYHGEINPITKARVNNAITNQSFGYLNGGKIDFVSDPSLPIKASKDASRSEAEAFYWLGDSFVVGSTYYVFGLYIAKEGALGFNQVGEDLFAFPIKDGKVDFGGFRSIYDSSTSHLSYFSSDGSVSIIFGSAIFENTESSRALSPDGYLYIYGYMDRSGKENGRCLVAARVKEEEVEDFSKYSYWDGSSFVSDISSCAPLTEGGNVSCEMSVCEINDESSSLYGKYVLTYQDNTIGKDVCLRVSSSPFSAFGEKKVVYHAEETSLEKGLSQYNAKAHPVLSDDGELVITYNLNESGSNKNVMDADIYHPRFLRYRFY